MLPLKHIHFQVPHDQQMILNNLLVALENSFLLHCFDGGVPRCFENELITRNGTPWRFEIANMGSLYY